MVVLKEVEGIQLNEGNLMAKGLFNLSTENDVSMWFDSEIKDRLLKANDSNFLAIAKEILTE